MTAPTFADWQKQNRLARALENERASLMWIVHEFPADVNPYANDLGVALDIIEAASVLARRTADEILDRIRRAIE